MMKHDTKLIEVFKRLHGVGDKYDVRLMEDNNGDATGVGLYKDARFCWGASLAELALDLILESSYE